MQHYLHQCCLPAERLSIDIGARLQQDSNSRQEILTENEGKNKCVRKCAKVATETIMPQSETGA